MPGINMAGPMAAQGYSLGSPAQTLRIGDNVGEGAFDLVGQDVSQCGLFMLGADRKRDGRTPTGILPAGRAWMGVAFFCPLG